MEVQNASYLKRYFGLHMAEGVCDYSDTAFKGRVLVLDTALDKMDPTFSGKPLFIDHEPTTTPDIAEEKGHGVVVKSFRNPFDGKRWVEFMADEEAVEKIEKMGWLLSNCYGSQDRIGGGKWHNVDYAQEIISGEYRHLALVPVPRYGESIILTPEQFAAYNSRLEEERAQFVNSGGDSRMKNVLKVVGGALKLFNSQEAPAAKLQEIADTTIELSNGRQITYADLVNEAEEREKKKDDDGDEMANASAMVECGGEKMNVGAMIQKYNEMKNELEERKKKDDDHQNSITSKDAEFEARLKTEVEKAAKEAREKALKEATFSDLQNAGNPNSEAPAITIDLPQNAIDRGRNRYGSGK